jgi:hypothetical protein
MSALTANQTKLIDVAKMIDAELDDLIDEFKPVAKHMKDIYAIIERMDHIWWTAEGYTAANPLELPTIFRTQPSLAESSVQVQADLTTMIAKLKPYGGSIVKELLPIVNRMDAVWRLVIDTFVSAPV